MKRNPCLLGSSTISLRLGLTLGFTLQLGWGCASQTHPPADLCEARAREEYTYCVQPVYFPGTPHEPVKSDATQACRWAYQKAVGACPLSEDAVGQDGPPGLLIGTSSTASDPK